MGNNYLPGQRTGRSVTPRTIFASSQGQVFLDGPIVIDATYAIDGSNTGRTDELRAGCLMAQITASKLWVPLKRTTVAEGFSGSGSGNTGVSLDVVDASFFKAGDTIAIATRTGGTLSRTISSVDYTDNSITVTEAIDGDPSVGDAVYANSTLAGAETCRGILSETVRLLTPEPYNTTQYDNAGILAIAGYVNDNHVLGDLAAARADTNAKLGNFMFTDEHGH